MRRQPPPPPATARAGRRGGRAVLCVGCRQKMRNVHIGKFFTNITIILLCVYTVILLNPRAKYNATVDIQPNITLPGTTKAHFENVEKTGFLEELKQRRATIRKVCTKSTLYNRQFLRSMYKKVLFRLYVDRKHKFAWCPTFKAASSTILRLFASMGGILTEEAELKLQKEQIQINKLTRKAFPPLQGADAHKVIYSSNRMMVVRHPFARLLSAYRDKLEHKQNREYYYEKYGKYIVKAFGNPAKQVEPTFVDFLKAVAKKFSSDEHWRPYYTECAPCLLDYNIVLKTESLTTELKQVLTVFNLADYFPNRTIHINPNGTTDWQIIKKYYSSVPPKLLEEVYNIYQADFEMFNYSPDQYFNMTR